MNPELAKTTQQTKSRLFPSTAKWPKYESPKKNKRAASAQVVSEKKAQVLADDQP